MQYRISSLICSVGEHQYLSTTGSYGAPIFEHYRFRWNTSVGIEFSKRGFDVDHTSIVPVIKEFEKIVQEHILKGAVKPIFAAEKSTHLMLPEQIQELKTQLRLDLKKLMRQLVWQVQKVISE